MRFYVLIFMYWYTFLEFFIFISMKRIRIELNKEIYFNQVH